MTLHSTAEADAAIAATAAVNGQLLDQLMELENHIGHRLLRAATGASRDRFHAVCDELASLWSLYRRHTATLTGLRDLRRRRRRLDPDDLAAMARILAGVDVPVPPRSAVDLVRAMERLGAQVRGVLDGVDRVRTHLDPRLDRCTAHLAAAAGHAAALDADAGARVTALQDRVAALQAVALTDPLSRWSDGVVDTADVDALEEDCARAAEELAGAAELRGRVDEALDEARAALRAVEGREWAATLRQAEVAVKIVPPGPEPRPGWPRRDTAPGSAAVRTAITRAARRVEAADWVGFAAAMVDVRAAVAAATTRAEALRHEVDRPLRARLELRGCLDLYRAKAAAIGRGEDVALDRLHRRAHDLLWTAPTSIAAARDAVDAYRRAVNRPAGRDGGDPA